MATSKKKDKTTSNEHLHMWDIPAKYFPRNSKAKDYANDLSRTTWALQYTNTQVQYAAQICAFSIKSITQKSGFSPSPEDLFDEIEKFVYHYENYCYRLYTYREKLIQFVNAVLPIGYTDKEVRIRHIIINPVVKQAGILPLIQNFGKNTALSKVIGDRTKLTHRLYYMKETDYSLRPLGKFGDSPEEFKRWCDEWKKEFMKRARLSNECTKKTSEISNEIAQKVVNYKDSLNIS